MPLTFTECFDSGSGSIGQNASNTYTAIVSGDSVADNADDPGTVVLFAAAKFAATSPFQTTINNLAWTKLGVGIWQFTATYVPANFSPQTGASEFSFTTGGGTQHIVASRQTIASYNQVDSEQVPPSYYGLINVHDQSVDGLDIDLPIFAFKTTFYVPPNLMSKSYVQLVYKLTGRVNNDLVNLTVDGISLTFQPGELRFKYGEGRKRPGYGDWELTFYWEAIGNETNLSVGKIKGIAKRGWDYLWVQTQYTNIGALAQTPLFVYIEQIYDYQALNPLLIPTGFDPQQIQNWQTPEIGD